MSLVLDPPIIVTNLDLHRLHAVQDLYDVDPSNALLNELGRATVVGSDEVPADVATMNSEVAYGFHSPIPSPCFERVLVLVSRPRESSS